jgi:hypothetical protein
MRLTVLLGNIVRTTMKNSLESLGKTVGLGFVLTVIMVVLIQVIH